MTAASAAAAGDAGDRGPSRDARDGRDGRGASAWRRWAPALTGVVALSVAVGARPGEARAAAAQDWSPFVLVAGLLLVGLVADGDGLFAAAGHRLATTARRGVVLYVGAAVVIGVVTALLNLDTAVAFLTPVLVVTARRRGEPDGALLYGCLLLANASSLFLPGSNLTNLIVLGHLHLSGGGFLHHLWAPALAALVVTAAVVGVLQRRTLAAAPPVPDGPRRGVTLGVGLAAVVAATVLVVVLRTPALPVLGVGLVAVTVRVVGGQVTWRGAVEVVGPAVLIGLFGVGVALGTLGRAWDGPERLLGHLDLWGVGVVAALASVLLNNLPAASLLAARTPPHPFALLVGLNIGPNLFVSGSLAWILWLRVAQRAGARPSIRTAAGLGAVAVPLALAAALGLLAATGSG